QWQKDRITECKKLADEYGDIQDEYHAAAEAVLPKVLDPEPFGARRRTVNARLVGYFECTNFDAKHRFGKNPFCISAIDLFQPVLDKLKRNEMDGAKALFGYHQSVLIGCAMTPKTVEAFQKLEEMRKWKAQQ